MGDNVGAPNFTMRHFEVAPGGRTPFHAHPWEHEVYVLSGTGKVRQKGGERAPSEAGGNPPRARVLRPSATVPTEG